ncbi:MAG: O-antigen ligase family protein [Xanthobacteraceae bacterium]|nr:O-antigen ligase family protein [Xanthobacteraceae bacterium]
MTASADRARLLSWPTRDRQMLMADILATGVVVALPWSTSVTEILVWLWLIAAVPLLDPAALRRVLKTPAGGLPILLLLLGLIGMLWAFGVPMKERWDGFKSFYKFLFIPLLIVHFLTSKRGAWVLIGYLASCGALLVVSALTLIPGFPWQGRNGPGLPVRDPIAQSGEFIVCIFVFATIALDAWKNRRPAWTILLSVLILLFLANILALPAISRTSFVVLPVLLLLFGFRCLSRKGALAVVLCGVVVAGLAWSFSHSARENVTGLINEVRNFESQGDRTRAGERIEFWKKSVGFIAAAPVIGHGIGSIPDQFRQTVVNQTGMAALASSNPHNQTLAVAIQLGVVGTVVLWAMWIAHLLLFRAEGLAAWVGLVIVTQNVVGSLFNSHLFDFTQGWGYVMGVGVAAGMVLQQTGPRQAAEVRDASS